MTQRAASSSHGGGGGTQSCPHGQDLARVGPLTRMRLSMMSLQSCRLVALVTSKNKLHVVFLI